MLSVGQPLGKGAVLANVDESRFLAEKTLMPKYPPNSCFAKSHIWW